MKTPFELLRAENADLRAKLQLVDERAFDLSARNARLRSDKVDLLAALKRLVSRIAFYSGTPADQRPCIEQWEYTEGSSDMADARETIARVEAGK